MFYYFGRKKRIAHLYPSPKFGNVVEPFAGSAAYSLHSDHWENEVTLCDTNQMVIGLWNYLKSASAKDILSLPDLKQGQKTTDFKSLNQEERNLIGLHINPGSAVPKITCVAFSRWKPAKKYIAENIHKIKHWTIINGSFDKLKNTKATWFIDPPYQKMGKHYAGGNSLEFTSLGLWCQSRMGQVIVCEANGATWLPFKFLTDTKNVGQNRNKELMWCNLQSEFK